MQHWKIKIFGSQLINELEPISLETNESKIAITFKEKISNSILEQLHTKLIV